MKRFICLLLSALILIPAAALAACSRQTGDPSETEAETKHPPAETQIVEQDLDPDASYVTGNYIRVDGKTIQSYPRLTNLPTLYIDLKGGAPLSSVQHGTYSSATYTFVDQYLETSYYKQPLSIKGRGNYSWSFAQKPYTLKLDASADFLGMGAAKKWVLVTVSSDKSMLHNYLTQKMALKMGLPGTCENEYVDVVVNGSYAGTFVLTEKIQLHESRINIPDSQGILFEIEMVYRHTCDLCVIMYNNKHDKSNSVHLELMDYKGQEPEEMTKATRQSVQKELDSYFERVEDAMTGGDFAALSAILDIDSFVNWYLLNELTRNYDSAFVTSCYCFIDENGKLFMGPCWDYDTCYGIQFSETDGSRIQEVAPWYNWLFTYSPDFVNRVEARWTEMRAEGGLMDWFLHEIDVTVERIALSEKMEHALYPNSELYNVPYEDAVQYMKDWLDERLVWMDEQFLKK